MASGSALHDLQGDPASTEQVQTTVPVGAGLLVLTRDEALAHTLQVLGPQYEIFTVGAESEFASHLLAQSTGVAILDASAVGSPIERLTERLRAQFPELVLIVAGGVDDQSALATQITNGTVYRFLHKPVSEQRVKLFVDAAWRRHSEEHASVQSVSAGASPARERINSGPNMLLLGGALAALIAAAAGWLLLHKSAPNKPEVAQASAIQTSAPEAPRDEVLENLLSRADSALASGALVSPPGANAADLYRQAQKRNARDPRAASGLEKVINGLLSNAEAQLLAQHLDEAQRLTDEARAIKPDHVRAAFLMAQIAKERERAVLAQARQAVSGGKIEEAISVLDGASAHSPDITQARQELKQKEVDERVREYVRRANDRMRAGQLLEPAQDNARFYVESARALAPTDAEVKQTRQQFLDRLVSEAHKALAADNADQGERWIQAATEAGASSSEIDSLKKEADHVRAAAKTDALAALALLVNQRLAQGKVLDPANDSAKYYLAQLEQSDSSHPSTLAARKAFAARTLSEAKSAVARQDYAGAQRWLSEAQDAGAESTAINAVNDEIRSAQDAARDAAQSVKDTASSVKDATPNVKDTASSTKDAAPNAKQASEVDKAPALEIIRYVPPQYPVAARKDALSGWVDVQFTVKTDGSVTDLSVVGAQPTGVFEEPALDAVRRWRYKPVLRDGQPINQRTRVRVRFALQQ
jgi:protein TonB